MKGITIDPCVFGSGVVCGGETHVNPDCSIEISAGCVIFPSGTIVHFPTKQFRYYKLSGHTSDEIKSAVAEFLKASGSGPASDFFELTDDTSNTAAIDSLKQQHPEDETEHDFMMDKIVTLYLRDGKGTGPDALSFLLLSRDSIAISRGVKSGVKSSSQGIFSRAIKRKQIDLVTIDRFLRPELNLPVLNIRRFGYQTLALKKPAHGLKEENLQHPFTSVNSFKAIFFEYKAIIDDEIEAIQHALEELHFRFGGFLTHKGIAYLEKYRKVLMAKWQRFCEEGDHLYYVQYFYDWLCDLVKAYNELVVRLDRFSVCQVCHTAPEETHTPSSLVLLGPVLGGRSAYYPLVFRDLAQTPMTDEGIREIRCLHWRLMMMIWTFDLPLLQLDRVLYDFGFDPGLEEALDSTNYWEALASDESGRTDLEYVPIKITPTKAPESDLGKQAIPYYYPLDSNSAYSLHQFWDYRTTRMRQSDTHFSYNAHPGDPEKLAMDMANDSYTDRIETIMPLAFSLCDYRFLRVEGHIGKSIVSVNESDSKFEIKGFPLWPYIKKYNLCLDVIAIGLPGNASSLSLQNLTGLQHTKALQQGNTLVLMFVDNDSEQIELQECKKDIDPEVQQYTIVADFILPYRYSCCPLTGVTVLYLEQDT